MSYVIGQYVVNLSVRTFNKHSTGLKVKCLKIPNATYTKRCRSFEKPTARSSTSTAPCFRSKRACPLPPLTYNYSNTFYIVFRDNNCEAYHIADGLLINFGAERLQYHRVFNKKLKNKISIKVISAVSEMNGKLCLRFGFQMLYLCEETTSIQNSD
ncbi:hypothetical protein MNBD_BACTEROID01-1332 [hydrothermal vent metagenome]|uniref:Uncharacterized protein n=1 Tax=hydrothermal vent metagenome TaxID=652676 RepID=A0A3B0UP10_9ZZZZ